MWYSPLEVISMLRFMCPLPFCLHQCPEDYSHVLLLVVRFFVFIYFYFLTFSVARLCILLHFPRIQTVLFCRKVVFLSKWTTVFGLKVERPATWCLKGFTASGKLKVYGEKKCVSVRVRERAERQRGRQTEWVCVCSLALTGVSFPGMNNLYSSNHTTLVILFSRACLQFPHRSTKTTSNSSSTYFSLLSYLLTISNQNKDIRQCRNTYWSTAAGLILLPLQLCVSRAFPFSQRVSRSDSARGYANWSVGVVSRWHRSTSSIASFAPAPPSETIS